MYSLNHDGAIAFHEELLCIVLALAAVVMRFFCKIKYKQGIHADDYWIIAGILFFYAMMAIVIWGRFTGGGSVPSMIQVMIAVKKNPKNAQVYRNYLMSFALGIFPGWISVFCIKISVLMFYRRLFFITKWFQHASLALMIITGAWLISTIVSFSLSAQPFDAYWNIFTRAKRLNFPLLYLLIGVIDTVIDVLVVALPMTIAFRLHLPFRAKVGVAGIFAVGAFVVGTNITRLILVYGTGPWTGQMNLMEDERWQNIHTMVGIICACLPVYKPLWNSISTSAGGFFDRHTISLRSIFGSWSADSGKDRSKANNPSISQVRLGVIDSPRTSNSKVHDVEQGYNSRQEPLLF